MKLEILKNIKKYKIETILDIGIGIGDYSKEFITKNTKLLIGIDDLSKNITLQELKYNLNENSFFQNIEFKFYPEKSVKVIYGLTEKFDLIIIESTEHLQTKIAEFNKALELASKFIIIDCGNRDNLNYFKKEFPDIKFTEMIGVYQVKNNSGE